MIPGGVGHVSSWSDRHAEITRMLEATGVEAAGREAGWLIEEVGGPNGVDRARADNAGPTEAQAAALRAMVDRRCAGEPVQYVLGHWPFRTLELRVDRRVLIPRPETEQVAEVALAEIDRMANAAVAVDLGTGSGALALALAVERPTLDVWAVERDLDALDVAAANVAAHANAGDRVRLLAGDWFGPLPDELRGAIDLVVSNPPYVEAGADLPESVVDWEPAAALFSGPDGLDAIRTIVLDGAGWLAPHGVLVVEIGAGQGVAAADFARRAGFHEVDVRPDIAGLDRVLVARRPNR